MAGRSSFSPRTGLLSDATSTAMGFFLAAGFFTKCLNCLSQSVVTLFIIIQQPLVLICTKGGPKTFCLRQICLGGSFSKITSDRLHIRFPFGQIYSISISGLWSSSQSQTHFVLPADKADVFFANKSCLPQLVGECRLKTCHVCFFPLQDA